MRKLPPLGRPFGPGQEATNRWLLQVIDEISKASAEKDKGVDSDGLFNSIVVARGFALSGVSTPAAFVADQDDLALADINVATVFRLSGTAARAITGIIPSTLRSGGVLIIVNVGAFNLTLPSASAASAAANRFLFPAANVVILPEGSAHLWYDATSLRWRWVGGTVPA